MNDVVQLYSGIAWGKTYSLPDTFDPSIAVTTFTSYRECGQVVSGWYNHRDGTNGVVMRAVPDEATGAFTIEAWELVQHHYQSNN